VSLEETLQSLAYELAKRGVKHVPRPKFFMTSHEGAVGYAVHDAMTPSRLYTFEYRDSAMPAVAVIANSATWAELAAHNLARAYRPVLP
jgi:hypothetical protein